MAQQYPKAGANDTSAFLISAIPWVTQSALPTSGVLHISLPYATKFLFIRNAEIGGSTLRVGFSENGVTGNPASESRFFDILEGQTRNLELRVKDLFLTGTSGAPVLELVAGLSVVKADMFPAMTGSLSGSGIFGGVG